MKRLALTLALMFATSAALGGEWATWVVPNGVDVLAEIEQDGAQLVMVCNAKLKLVWIGFREPRANWQKGAEIGVVTRSDEGSQWPAPSHGIVMESTRVMIIEDAITDLWLMGKAKTSFTISAGGYTRAFDVTNLREVTERVLAACEDRRVAPKETPEADDNGDEDEE
jgi:hypothetical protein